MNVSILLVRGLLSELRGRGLDERQALLGTGVEVARLADLSAVVTVAEWSQIVWRAQALTGSRALAASAGQHLPLSALHWLNHLLHSATTLRGAIEVFSRYQCLIAEPLTWTLYEQGDEARYVCSSILQGDASQFAVEFALGIALRVGERLAPRSAGGQVHVRLAVEAPQQASDYVAHFGCVVNFGAPENAIVFPRALLDEERQDRVRLA